MEKMQKEKATWVLRYMILFMIFRLREIRFIIEMTKECIKMPMLLKKGVVVRKWSNNNLPDEYQLTDRLENLPLGHSDERSFMLKIVHVVAWFALPLLFFCLLDLVWERYRKNRNKENEK